VEPRDAAAATPSESTALLAGRVARCAVDLLAEALAPLGPGEQQALRSLLRRVAKRSEPGATMSAASTGAAAGVHGG
jgi:hypothetical protein